MCDDYYEWVQLLATEAGEKVVACKFAKTNDEDAIDDWRHSFDNTDIFQSICIYAEPDLRARYVILHEYCNAECCRHED